MFTVTYRRLLSLPNSVSVVLYCTDLLMCLFVQNTMQPSWVQGNNKRRAKRSVIKIFSSLVRPVSPNNLFFFNQISVKKKKKKARKKERKTNQKTKNKSRAHPQVNVPQFVTLYYNFKNVFLYELSIINSGL